MDFRVAGDTTKPVRRAIPSRLTEATLLQAASNTLGGITAHSRSLAPNEKVFVTQGTVKRDR